MTERNHIEQSLRQENLVLFEQKLILENRINAALNVLENPVLENTVQDTALKVIQILRGEVR